MSITVTTDLPDEDQPTLGNGVEDEVAVDRETSPSNYGSVRIQIRETGQSSWDDSATGFSEQVVAHDTLSTIFAGLEDGEAYEVRARTETEHRTGSWTTPVSITTKFPGVTGATVTGSTKTSVSVEGTDNADNEDGVRLQRQRRYDSGWGPWRTVAERGPVSGTGSFAMTDESASPGNEYRYRFEPFTEDTAAASTPTDPVETPASGRPRTRTGSSGWRVEIDHPDSQTPLRPRLLDDPQQEPRVNDLPRLRIPVPYNEKWQASGFEDATLRVWKDGVQQPIDTLVDVTHETRQGAKRTILHGRGGGELKQTVTEEFDLRETHLAARDLIQNHTSYGVDVDEPTESVRKDVAMKSVDSESDWQNDQINAIAPEEPWTITSDGKLHRKQTSWLIEGESIGSAEGTTKHENYAGFEAVNLGALVEFGPWEFTTDHVIPADECQIGLRLDTDGGSPAFDVYLDGTRIGGAVANALLSGIGWYSWTAGFELSPGTHSITIDVTAFGNNFASDALRLDILNAQDTRQYSDDSLPEDNRGIGGPLPGPPDYSTGTRELSDASSGQQIVGGRLDATIDDTSGDQALAISHDQGQSWVEASNTDTVEGDFESASSRIRARVTLGGYGERTGPTDLSPAYGFKPQSVDAYELYADIDETPTLINQSEDDHLDRVLRDWADQGGFIWEVQLDESTGTPVVVWTQPGQRDTSVDPDLVDYRVRKRTGEVYEAVTVVGASTGVHGEHLTVVVGEPMALANQYLVDGSETVYDPTSDTNYERGLDYEISYLNGKVTVLETGSIPSGSEVAVDYRYETRGQYALDSVDEPRRAPKQPIPGLTSPEACEQAAATIVAEVSEPLWEVEFTVSPGDLGWQVSDALQVDALPVDKPVEVQQVQNSPSEITVTGGTRQTVEAVVRQLRERVDQVSRRT